MRPKLYLAMLVVAFAALSLWLWSARSSSQQSIADMEDGPARIERASQQSPETALDVPLAENITVRTTGVDWSAFLGPTADGKSPEKGIQPWPSSGPKIRWQSDLGEGYGSVAVSRGRVLLFERIGNEEICRCLQSETGKLLWRFAYPSNYRDKFGFDNGPRSCPVTDGRRVYLHGAEGMLHCLRLTDGKLLWKVDTFAAFGVIPNFFGVGNAPLIDGDKVLVHVGGSPPGSNKEGFTELTDNGTSIVAFDKSNGKVLYRCGKDLASYASPQVATLHGKKIGLILARNALHGFDLQSGSDLFRFSFRSRILESVNASNVIVDQDSVFISECYGAGCTLQQITDFQLTERWSSPPRRRDTGLACHWSTPILVNGHLYGCHGRHESDAELRCVDWQTGKVKWRVAPSFKAQVTTGEVEDITAGRGSLTLVDGHFVYLTEEGCLFLFKENADSYQQVSSWYGKSVLFKPCWSSPVVSHGLLYVRCEGRLVCFELIPSQ